MKLSRSVCSNILAMHQFNLDKKAINPVFSLVQIYSEGNALKFTSTDGQRYLRYSLYGSYDESSVFINGSLLYELVKKSKSESFQIKETYESYKVLLDNAEFKFAKYADTKFPDWVDDYDYSFQIKSSVLSEGLKGVKWSSSNEDARPLLNGVCFDIHENMLNLCATDGLRLALLKIPGDYGFVKKFILGNKSVSDLVKVLDDCRGVVNISIGKYFRLTFSNDDKEIVWKSSLIFGDFPDYNQAIPSKFYSSFIADVKQISESVNRIMIVANQNQPSIILSFDDTSPSKVMAESATFSGEDVLEGEYAGKKMKVLLNGRFLQEALNNLSGKIIFELKDPSSPVALKNIENNGSMFIIAPVKQDY